jgi:hypothetical protein
MKKFLEKNHRVIIITLLVLSIGTLFKGCANRKVVSNLEKQVESKNIQIDSLVRTIATKDDVKNTMENVMLDYLIYEDELDNKKITLSNIKDKIND